MQEQQDMSMGGADQGYTGYMGGGDQSSMDNMGGGSDQSVDTNPTTISGMELMSGKAGLWSGTFYQRFQGCMNDMHMPAPDTLFGAFTQAVSTIKSIYSAISAAGDLTISELIAAGVLGGEFAELAAAVGGVAASAYVGVCVGCLASAGIDYTGLF